MCQGSADCTGCCSFPHGPMSPWALIFCIIAYAFAINASYGCSFVQVNVDRELAYFVNDTGSLGLGLLTYQDKSADWDYACVVWSYDAVVDYMDSAWRAARAFGILGNISIGVPMITSIILACMRLPMIIIRIMTGLLILGVLAECLTFVAFASDICAQYNCVFSWSAGLAIGAAISAAIAAIFYSKLSPAEDGGFVPAVAMGGGGGVAQPPGTVTVTETIEPDGTKKIVKSTVNADGSRTVEETIERPTAAQAY